MPRLAAAIVVALLTLAACAMLHQPIDVDPDATFAAHRAHDAIVIDRLVPGQSGALAPPAWLRLPGAPVFALTADGDTRAAVWRSGSEVTVRRSGDPQSPLVGQIVPSWDDGAVRFALTIPGAPGFRTDPFLRRGIGNGPDRLTRIAQTVIDVRGSYEALVRDAKAAVVGWMRVGISPYAPAPRIFEDKLPPTVPPELAAGAAAALDAEIDWIEDHALDVYRGERGGPLKQSVPVGH